MDLKPAQGQKPDHPGFIPEPCLGHTIPTQPWMPSVHGTHFSGQRAACLFIEGLVSPCRVLVRAPEEGHLTGEWECTKSTCRHAQTCSENQGAIISDGVGQCRGAHIQLSEAKSTTLNPTHWPASCPQKQGRHLSSIMGGQESGVPSRAPTSIFF